MGSTSRELEFWFEQLEKPDINRRIQAIDKLIEIKHPKIIEILTEIAETENNEKVRIRAIQALGGYSGVLDTLRKLLIGESTNIRKAAIRAIVDLGDISAIRYLTRYDHSSFSDGVRTEVKLAINDLLKILEEKKRNAEQKGLNKDKLQQDIIDETPKSEEDLDYKKYIKKFFD